ncbi:hypothetical protein SEA_AFLAC_86 [Gordonia phage Aflac]|nr:hypothetical protein SEA_AFLAC_86 [Gordonia phage Aflac]
MEERKIDVSISTKDQKRIIQWYDVSEEGFRLLMTKVVGASQEEIDRMLGVLDRQSLDQYESKEDDYVLFATMYK